MDNIKELIELLDIEKIEQNLFRGQNYQAPWGRVFGGQVMAQALRAARNTVDPDRTVHSLHSYFILPGDLKQPIIFEVDRIRDGRSFTTRTVKAIQNGKAIFNLSASFQIAEMGLDHHIEKVDLVDPSLLPSDIDVAERFRLSNPPLYARLTVPRPFEYRLINAEEYLDRNNISPVRRLWLKAKTSVPPEMALQREILAYASDYYLLTTSLLPHRAKVKESKVQFASIDHAMWFHREFDISDWLMYELESPSASGARGFNTGKIYNKRGVLVATVAQEGLMRIKADTAT